MYRWAEEWRQNGKSLEFARLALEGRRASFDIESRLLEEYYQNTAGMRALRVRGDALAELLREEGRRLIGREARELRVLVLEANTVLSLPAPSAHNPAAVRVSLLIVDGDTQALRLARQRVETVLGVRPNVLLVRPNTLGKSLSKIHAQFDIICTLTQYDRLSPEAALELTRRLAEVLRPGGALITGTYFPGVPAPYRALVAAFMEVYWRHWDEAMWREMLGQLPFDLSASRFEVIPPATMTVLARRS
jgi:SAM-dependent methyltransferase